MVPNGTIILNISRHLSSRAQEATCVRTNFANQNIEWKNGQVHVLCVLVRCCAMLCDVVRCYNCHATSSSRIAHLKTMSRIGTKLTVLRLAQCFEDEERQYL